MSDELEAVNATHALISICASRTLHDCGDEREKKLKIKRVEEERLLRADGGSSSKSFGGDARYARYTRTSHTHA